MAQPEHYELLEPESPADSPFEWDETAAAELELARKEAAETVTTDSVRAYYNQIGKVALLEDAAAEAELAKRIEAGLLADKIVLARKEGPEAVRELLEQQRLSGPDYRSKERYKQGAKRVAPAVEADLTSIMKLAGATQSLPTRELELLVADGERAKTHLTEANLRLVVSLAKRYVRGDQTLPLLDLISEGNLGLIRAVEKFDYTKGWKFSTYATWWIRQSIQRGIADKARLIRLPVHEAEKVNKFIRVKRDMIQELGRDPTEAELADELDVSLDKITEYERVGREVQSLDMNIGDDDSPLGNFIEDKTLSPAEETVGFGLMQGELMTVLGTLDEREANVIKLRYGLVDGRPWTLDEIGQVYKLSRERIRQIERETLAKLRHPSRSEVLRGYLES